MSSPRPSRTAPPTFVPPKPLDLTAVPSISQLIQGPPGTGKTHHLCSMPSPILVGVTESNTAVYQGFKEQGVDLTALPVDDWETFQWFVRLTKNRQWGEHLGTEPRTVGIDVYGLIGTRLVMDKKANPSNVTGAGQLQPPVWDQVKGEQWTEILDFAGAVKALAGKPSYHIVVCSHEYEDLEVKITRVGGRPVEESTLRGVYPEAPGSFRKSFAARFDCAFLSGKEPKLKEGGGPREVVGTSYFLRTVPPDKFRQTKDGFGGKAGRGTLPPKVGNTWADLCGAWGVDPETLKVKATA